MGALAVIYRHQGQRMAKSEDVISRFYHSGCLLYMSLFIVCSQLADQATAADRAITGIHKHHVVESYYLADYYVATYGNDDNPGTYQQPFATWQKGFESASAGHLVYIRGGVYTPTFPVKRGSDCCGVYILNKGGTSSDTIKIFAYPGETPVLDLDEWVYHTTQNGIMIEETNGEADYWYIKGLTIRNISQQIGQSFSRGIILLGADHCVIKECIIHNIGGVGIYGIKNGSNYTTNHTIINCDSYDNYDPYSNPDGGNADGFQFYDADAGTITLTGCRAWNNSDDGYDFFDNDGVVIIENCWSFDNGYQNGDGTGFKLGSPRIPKLEGIYQREIKNSLAIYNDGTGFYENQASINMKLYNNVSAFNGVDESSSLGTGFQFYYNSTNDTNILINNISYSNYRGDSFNSTVFHTTNSWNHGVPAVTSLDFVSLDTTGIRGVRGSDGSLPNIDLFKIANGSILIDAGTDVGLPYNQAAPDLGFNESDYKTPSGNGIHYSVETDVIVEKVRILLLILIQLVLHKI